MRYGKNRTGLRIYLAGKVQKNCWRHTIVTGLRESLHSVSVGCPGDKPDGLHFPVMRNAIFGKHHYTGPHFLSCDHGCWHGQDHGLAKSPEEGGAPLGPNRDEIAQLCLRAVSRSDIVFAWIDTDDCYGTIAEIGVARGLGKQIVVASPVILSEMWFVYQIANLRICGQPDRPPTPRVALELALDQL